MRVVGGCEHGPRLPAGARHGWSIQADVRQRHIRRLSNLPSVDPHGSEADHAPGNLVRDVRLHKDLQGFPGQLIVGTEHHIVKEVLR